VVSPLFVDQALEFISPFAKVIPHTCKFQFKDLRQRLAVVFSCFVCETRVPIDDLPGQRPIAADQFRLVAFNLVGNQPNFFFTPVRVQASVSAGFLTARFFHPKNALNQAIFLFASNQFNRRFGANVEPI
jgi:hypothetical protein